MKSGYFAGQFLSSDEICLVRKKLDWIVYVVVTCEMKLFQNYFRGSLQLTNIFQRVQCRRNNFEIISAASRNNFISVSDVVACEIKHQNNFRIILN